MANRRAKIVCTLGPATATSSVLTELVDAGMDVARLNFSHSTHAEHSALYGMVREIAAQRGRVVGVLADLQGPKIRLGCFADGPVVWATGEHVTITTEDCPGDHDRVSTTYAGLSQDVRAGDRLLVDDGRVDLRVVAVDGPDIRCEVVDGGPVSDHKGISLPNIPVSVPPLSDKDIEDLKFALELGADMIAMSFVRAPEEVELAHKIMDEVGRRVPVIAKLEKPEAVSDLPAIVEAFDGLMVARGDLGVEMPLEQIPLVQRRAIALCRQAAKPVIVATQMLDSMVSDRRPTRAEVSDVANAVFDRADAVMLSAETSVGADPAHAVATMARIVVAAESGSGRGETPESALVEAVNGTDAVFGDAIAVAACEVGRRLGAAALCCFTRTGDTALRLARQRSPLPLLAFAHDDEVRGRLTFSWGVESAVLAPTELAESMPGEVSRALLSMGACHPGDVVVVVSGSRSGVAGYTDSVRVLRVE
ncbi:pyruvate kinase [Mycolicibacterium smegmatis]|uniref:Pyruvate kinase n=2 Tax=Mycolicibacterium smegmatis (strain ATCC 700084 / mc(2)155) TaxID=246196 RepID=A0QNT2_MYCS2|nr:pyruvate kinase [Mycolicibacterium smegmatis]ABK69970.1 pyruvate kinase [Mycolicibacterium smegmatis MC2 155]AFP36632.1 Pyruvate kinase [Mycolicibacterium smegmatis MC2 155]AIU05435.1 pyruvate kinase [Mycolicibacterium smegmatis MC2 155]AIU12060.1 pyruvate kinase [Mycolicibacterium smegmatis]AIU18684.1 pyruvate kinase [Mycolicibacterium smegmatis]